MRVGRLEATAASPAAPSAEAIRPARYGEGAPTVSAVQSTHRADRVAGFLCAFSLALSGIAIVRNPGLLATAAIVVALVAVVMTRAQRTLAAVSVAVGAAAFLVGMVVAVLTGSALY